MAKLFGWVEKGVEPLRTYSTGLLSFAMCTQDIPNNYKDRNFILVSVK